MKGKHNHCMSRRKLHTSLRLWWRAVKHLINAICKKNRRLYSEESVFTRWSLWFGLCVGGKVHRSSCMSFACFGVCFGPSCMKCVPLCTIGGNPCCAWFPKLECFAQELCASRPLDLCTQVHQHKATYLSCIQTQRAILLWEQTSTAEKKIMLLLFPQLD